MKIEVKEEIDNHIKEIEDRLYNKHGGAYYDYANFCVYDDFVWLRDEVKTDFEYLPGYVEEEFSEDVEDLIDEFSDYIEEEKERILREIDEISENVDTDKIYDHIVNEVENRLFDPVRALKKLEAELIEKKVVSSLQKLEEIESYQMAKQYVESHSKESSPKEKEASEEHESNEDLLDMFSETIEEFPEERFENISKDLDSSENEEIRLEELFISKDKYVESLIRKPGAKQAIKKLAKEGVITNKEKNEYLKQLKYFLEYTFKEFKDFDKEKEEALLLDQLEEIKQTFKNSFENPFIEFQSRVLFDDSSKIVENFVSLVRESFEKAWIAQDKILELGSKENPLIFKYYENIAIIAEQIFISLEYEFNKFMKAAETFDYSMTTAMFDNEKVQACKEIIDNYKGTISAFIFQLDIAVFNLYPAYNTRKKIAEGYQYRLKQFFDMSSEQLVSLEEYPLDITILKYYKTLQNVFESFTAQIRYDLNCLSDKEITERAENFDWFSDQGSETFKELYETLKRTEELSLESLMSFLDIDSDLCKKLLSKNKLSMPQL